MNIISKCLVLAGLISTLAGTTSCTPKVQYPTKSEEQTAKEVRVGGIEYNKGPLISHGFLTCSSLIFDYGNEAIMTHVLKGDSYNYNSSMGLGANDVVKNVIGYSEKIGLDYRKAKVIIDAGSKSSLDRIISDLNKLNLKPTIIRDNRVNISERNPMVSTTIYYDPLKDILFERPSRDDDFKIDNLTEVY